VLRKDREITDKSVIESILRESLVCRLALCEGNTPYIVPMNFGFRDGCLYFHSAKKGRKIDILEKNNCICFEVDVRTEGVPADDACKWSMRYYSVIGFGKAYLVDDPEEKARGLDIIMEKYSGGGTFKYSDASLSNVVIINVKIDEVTGKKAGYQGCTL